MHYEQLPEDRPGGFNWGEERRNRPDGNQVDQQEEPQPRENDPPQAPANNENNQNQLRDRRPLINPNVDNN